MAISPEFIEFVLDQLRGLGPITVKSMFGSRGLYFEGRIFALMASDKLYFKVDDANRADYERASSEQFIPSLRGKPFPMPYWEVPLEVMEDSEEFCEWARRSYEAGSRAAAPGAGRRRPRITTRRKTS